MYESNEVRQARNLITRLHGNVRPRLELISSLRQLLDSVFINLSVLRVFVHLLGHRQALSRKGAKLHSGPSRGGPAPGEEDLDLGFGHRDRDQPFTIAYSD